MHAKYREPWLVALLFDDLLAWNDWMATDRALGPLGLVSLGSDTIDASLTRTISLVAST